jgi:hypothetical protein
MVKIDSAGKWHRRSKARTRADNSEKEKGLVRYIRKPFTPEQVKEHVVPLLEGGK